MATAPHEYQKGHQDIHEQQETFALFWSLTKWGIVVVALIMIVLAYFFT